MSSAAWAVTIEWVSVGDAGNAADTTGIGSVPTPYRISKFEITNAQYTEFLNAVAATDPNALYDTSMGVGSGGITRTGSSGSFVYTAQTGRENKPVRYVSFLDSARFANWLHNGQPTGAQDTSTTEDGAYAGAFARTPGAQVYIPTEDEWYKAAYYDPSTGSYFTTPLSTNVVICGLPGPDPNTANCNHIETDLTDVGAYTASPSPVGSFDQGGNVSEWTETLFGSSTFQRVRRGGDFADFSIRLLSNSFFLQNQVTDLGELGFRVATGPAPGAPAQEFFVIDPTQSVVAIANSSVLTVEFMGAVMSIDLPLLSQVGAGGTGTLSDGLSTNLSGHLLVDIPVGGEAPSIEIINRRSSVRLEQSGSWLPGLPESPETSAPAALAANLGDAPFALSIAVAVRDFELSVGHSGLPELLTDQGGGLFSFSLGYGNASLVAIPVNGIAEIEATIGVLGMLESFPASLALSVADVPSVVIGQGQLQEEPGGGRQLTIPLDASIAVTDDTFAGGLPLTLSLDLTGQIVATNSLFVPEPAAPLAWLVALATIAALRRTRSC